jgi:hypothetical protein
MRARFAGWSSLIVGAGLLAARAAAAEPSVWVVDDGEKIRRDATTTPFERGEGNPVWRPGEPVRLFAMRNETVALQVVVEADDDPLDGVTVDVEPLETAEGTRFGDAAAEKTGKGRAALPVGTPIERFVEHFVEVRRASDDGSPQRGWEPGSGPAAGAYTGSVPDALVPVEHAPAWLPYPMGVEARSNGIVWIDLNVPRAQAAGVYHGAITTRSHGRALGAPIPVELEVVDATLPDHTVSAAVAYDRALLESRVGPRAERHLLQLLHAHRVTPMIDATTPADLDRASAALTGALYTHEMGYEGPAPATGDGLVSIGAHGAFGAPDEATLARVRAVADRAAELKLFGSTELLFYAGDDACSSPWGAGWSALLHGDGDPNVRRLRVGWTCTLDPAGQPVDVTMQRAAFDRTQASAARAAGKEGWVHGGVSPRTGTFLLDADAVSPRVNGWLSAMLGIPRWVAGDAARWTTRAGEGIDPFAWSADDDAVTNGEGFLVYPGKQIDGFDLHTVGFEGVVPSIRLKSWRRGLEDAGYLQMARERDPARAEAIAGWLVPRAFAEAHTGDAPSWGDRGAPFADARRALLAVALGREPVVLADRSPAPALPGPGAVTAPRAAAAPGGTAATAPALADTESCAQGTTTAGGVGLLALVALRISRTLRSRRAGAPRPRAAAGAAPT